jgi:SAM-dependent methyltransferase
MWAKNKLEESIRPCPYCGKTDAQLKFSEPPFVIVKCRSCGLVYLGNPPSSDNLYDNYYGDDPNPADYCKESSDPSLRELYMINQRRVDLIKRLLREGKLLDIGCGRGFFLKTALESGFQVSGIDTSEKATAYARREFDLNVESIPVEKLSLSGRQFDIITLWHVVEHFSDPFIALKQIHKLLGDGGICIVEVPNLHSLKFMTARNKWHGGNHPLYHRTFFTADTLRKAFILAGFPRIRRVNISYHTPGKSKSYWIAKRSLNLFALDSFLDFVVRK